MRKTKKSGFTMTELVVVLVIIGILAAIAIPTAIHYIHLAQFRENEENAKTVYMGAESILTYYRSSGQWESFCDDVKKEGTLNTEFTDARKDRIYAITLDAASYRTEGDNLVLNLLDTLSYSGDFLSNAIGIEIDVATGEVYSAFYATNCAGLRYGEEEEGCLSMNDREYESRKERRLGYYSVEDVTNVVELEPVRLKVTSVNLVNSETLALSWSSNSRHQNMDVEFQLAFFNCADDKELFKTTVNLAEITANTGTTSGMSRLELEAQDGTKESYYFPITYENGKLTLVLDGMMSADVLYAIDNAAEKKAMEQTSSTSITRLSTLAPALSEQTEIYATISAVSTYKNMEEDTREYRASNTVSSNTANTLYADNTTEEDGTLKAEIAMFRHLSNIRYATGKAEFELTKKNMDWKAVGTGLYDFMTTGDGVQQLTWMAGSSGLDFPSIPLLEENQTLFGKGNTSIRNLTLGEKSLAKQDTEREFLGLFCEVEGKINNLKFVAPQLSIGTSEEKTSSQKTSVDVLKGVGILAGRSSGTINDITIEDESVVVKFSKYSGNTAAAGSVVGALAEKKTVSGKTVFVETTAKLTDISTGGKVIVHLPDAGTDGNATYGADVPQYGAGGSAAYGDADVPQYGVGGAVGFALLKGTNQIHGCKNEASISSSGFAGGIVGQLSAAFQNQTELDEMTKLEDVCSLSNCSNEGLVFCNTKEADGGKYFGGIVGYAADALLYSSESASGRAEHFSYEDTPEKRALLKGNYVGGILGYGSQTVLYDCGTKAGGYILGNEYVGGIVGGMKDSDTRQISGATVTVNAGYVIGNSYVGGIVGINVSNQIVDCVNNGLAVGYGNFIGGITGYNAAVENGKTAEIKDCASYLSDYNDTIYSMIVNNWHTTGNYVGGLAGYNNSQITFTDESEQVSVKAVSSIVVGNDYVGGLVGFNDVDGSIDVEYTLIGGHIYGTGDCVGGCIGLNASSGLMEKELTIKPTGVTGHYCVGGVIGANIIALEDGTTLTADSLSTDNSLGKVAGEAFCGGIIGYQKNYSSSGNITMLACFAADEAFKSYLIPSLSEDGAVPTYGGQLFTPTGGTIELTLSGETVVLAASTGTLLLTSKENTDASFSKIINNIPLEASVYSGGVVGYCAADSSLIIKNCKNIGNITKSGSLAVNVGAYLSAALPENKKLTEDQLAELNGFSADFIGGMIGVNQEKQTIEHCENSGIMYGFTGHGGIVGLNLGRVENCALVEHFGSLALDFIGGIAGINDGRITDCTTEAGKTISGKSYVGGITGYNLYHGTLSQNHCYASINVIGDCAGSIAGKNNGQVAIGADDGTVARSVTGRTGTAIGGLIGWNGNAGTIFYNGSEPATVINDTVTVIGKNKVGGIVGSNDGTIKSEKGAVLTVWAKLVRAIDGDAGGIAGESKTAIASMCNHSDSVEADKGNAGGIVAVNAGELTDCTNLGNVTSSQGNAGGIAATNEKGGTIKNSLVADKDNAVILRGVGAQAAGAVCAVNEGTITDSKAGGGVNLWGDATVYGGIAGINRGTIQGSGNTKFSIDHMPSIRTDAVNLSVGGVAGESGAVISNITVSASFSNFSNYRYLGGITGVNEEKGSVVDCEYTGTMTEAASAVGNCYGGIAGDNSGSLNGCTVNGLTMDIVGIYTATSTSTWAQKEALSSHAGGIAGKNEESGSIYQCYLVNSDKGKIAVENGMAGGVAGYNKGLISHSGDAIAKTVMKEITEDSTTEALYQAANSNNIEAVDDYVNTVDNKQIEDLSYAAVKTSVSAGKMYLLMEQNGNVGGITAFNAPTGALEYCVTGDWFINNKSNAIGVGTGGIIGMNESEQDLKYLVNCAFVGRQLSVGTTNRFAGGIIGNQNNATKSGWTIRNCINYGTVYCYNAHYSGGIMGQWTGTGGTIEGCRNYGSLQTSYQAGWTGAAAGIVAQLYHAKSGDTYNIISCGNYASIYGKGGKSANSANDSAGILGNVTTYQVSKQELGQSFTIQILDCVNASGLKVESYSMASGIVGFFSCDSPTNEKVTASTQNIVLRIERCRNFAYMLWGNSYIGGIFGDRYGEKGGENTTIRDCFSVSQSYNYKNNPIVSMTANSSTGYKNIKAEDNYFFGENTGYTDLHLYQNQEGTGDGSYTYTTGAADAVLTPTLARGGANMLYLVYDETNSEYAAVCLHEGSTLDKTCNISKADGVVTKDGAEIGTILCYLGAKPYSSFAAITAKECNYYDLVRGSYRYRNLEGWEETSLNGKTVKQLIAPTDVQAQLVDGKIELTITPAKDGTSDYDPFKYEVKIDIDGVEQTGYYLYSESGTIELPESASGKNIKVAVRAVSMYEKEENEADRVYSSEWTAETEASVKPILPTPDVRAELVRTKDSPAEYRYRFSLNNEEAYQNYEGYQVTIKFANGTTNVVLNASQPTALVEGDGTTSQEILVQASDENNNYQASIKKSIPIYLPKYHPTVSLNENAKPAAPVSVAVTGKSLSDLMISVTLDGSGTGNVDIPPVYRADLIGTWEDGKEVVFATNDILVTANGSATVNFTDFSEEISRASDLKIRVWYAQSGLGPVYTYFSLEGTETNGYGERITTFEGLDGDGNAIYSYSASPILYSDQFGFYKYQSDTLFTFLPAPVLMESKDTSGEEVSLTPEITDGELFYTFRWDTGLSGTDYDDARYEVALYGINAAGERVIIDTASAYTDAAQREMTINADSWNYENVELCVTRIGDAGTAKKVGLTTTHIYSVKQRLQQPGQPMAAIKSSNELSYVVSWNALSSESGCDSYQLYLQYSDGGSLVTKTLGSAVKATGESLYKKTVDLETYAGKTISIYLVAVAEANSPKYLDSIAGDAYTLTVPSRIAAPSVTWEVNWTTDSAKPVEKTAFETTGLTVSFTTDSTPPGGSAYLLRAKIYDSTADGAEPVAYYPAEDAVVEMTAVSNVKYQHTITGLSAEYAGKYIRFYTRITSGDGQISSTWVESDYIQLPYVQLQQPKAETSVEDRKFDMGVTNNQDVNMVEKEWQVQQQIINWEDVEYADAMYLTIQKTDSSAPVELRILKKELVPAESGYSIEVQEKATIGSTTDWYTIKGSTTEGEDSIYRFTLDGAATDAIGNSLIVPAYGLSLSGTYQREQISYNYDTTLYAELEVGQEGNITYALILPDNYEILDEENVDVEEDVTYHITDKVRIYADRLENENGQAADSYYVKSEEAVITPN